VIAGAYSLRLATECYGGGRADSKCGDLVESEGSASFEPDYPVPLKESHTSKRRKSISFMGFRVPGVRV
jgi:hypothetical protein